VDPVSREVYQIQESKSKTGEKGIHSVLVLLILKWNYRLRGRKL